MAKPPLTVQNAAIATASVEIKTLTVSGKQVTLAVFRQLREVPLITYEGTLAGQPWGIVNYHPDKCAAAPEHWHVVWQEGQELRRAAVEVKPVFEKTFWSEEGLDFIESCVHDVLRTGATPYFQGKLQLDRLLGADGINVETGTGFLAELSLSDKGRSAVAAWTSREHDRRTVQSFTERNQRPPEWLSESTPKREAQYADALAAFEAFHDGFTVSTDQLYERYEAAVQDERARRDRHLQVRKDLVELPQLFIAV